MLASIIAWLQEQASWQAYTVLALSAATEYIVPPFPGDTLALVGVTLAFSAGYSWFGVYIALTVGATAGGMLSYVVGRQLPRSSRAWPRVLQGRRRRVRLLWLLRRFRRRGALYLLFNRFVPAFRAFFFLAAGMSHLPWRPVLLYGALSSALWNWLLLALGFVLGQNLDALQRWVQRYTLGVLLLMGLLVGLVVVRHYWRARHAAS